MSLCAQEDRISYMARGNCPDCGGCIDDRCGGCRVRFCGGTYGWYSWTMPQDREPGSACDRCPVKVAKTITDGTGAEREIQVRCNAATGHGGQHHWDPYKATR